MKITPETIRPIGPGTAADPPTDMRVVVLAPPAVAAAVAAAMLVPVSVIEAVSTVIIPAYNI